MDDMTRVEKRAFPRIAVQCPVLYLTKPHKRWQVAKLMNFAATGMCIECDENLPLNAEISLQIKPGSIKTVPPLSVVGQVIRCESNQNQRFEVACKVLKILRNTTK